MMALAGYPRVDRGRACFCSGAGFGTLCLMHGRHTASNEARDWLGCTRRLIVLEECAGMHKRKEFSCFDCTLITDLRLAGSAALL